MMKRRKWVVLLLMTTLVCALGSGCGDGKVYAMRLTKTEGAVEVSDGGGRDVSPGEDMELSDGYRVDTGKESHAWMTLGGVKLVKTDEESEIEIQKDGKDLKVVVNSGGVFFYVAKPLGDDETFEIRTSAMTVGIREACGWVDVANEKHVDIFVLEGTVECGVTDPESGEGGVEQVSRWKKAEVRLHSKGEAAKYDITKERLEVSGIPSYVLEELLVDNGLRNKINDAIGVQIPRDGSSEAYVLRGNARVCDGETEENMELARLDYEKALELDKKNPQGYLGLADLKIRQGEYGEAVEILEDGLEKVKDGEKIKKKIEEMEGGEFTDSQHRMRRRDFYRDGDLAWRHDYYYDEQGRRTQIIAYDASGKRIGKGDEVYDGEGRKTQAYGWETQNGKLMKETYEFDEDGNRVKRNVYDTDGNFVYYDVDEYDGKGHLVKSSQYLAEGDLDVYYTYDYDGDGNRTRQNHYTEDGTLVSYHVYEYDENGNCVKDSCYRGNGKLRDYTVYEYDEDGELISERQTKE